MKIAILSILIFATTIPAHAYELSATVGFQTTSASTDTSGASIDSGNGLYGGLIGYMDIGDEHYIRGGALVSQRKIDVNFSGGTTASVETLNLDIPLTYMVLLQDMFGVFGGARLGLNISDDCSLNTSGTCTNTDIETLYLAAEVGGQIRFTPNIAMEFIFNLGLTDMAQNVAWDNSIAVGGMFLF